MNKAQIITVNKQHFAAGLFWQSLLRPRDYLREAKEIGKRERMDLVAIRRGRTFQAGFSTRQIAGAGAYSLAATLAGILGDDWVAVFYVGDDLYAIAAAKGGLIIPGCDAIGPREEIEESLRGGFNLHQFGRVICPAEFNFGGEEKDLSELLRSHKLRKEYRLQPLSGNGNWVPKLKLGAIVLVVAGAGLGGFIVYRKHMEEKAAAAAAAEAARQRQLEELKASAKQKDMKPEALEHPWASQPRMSLLGTACVDAIHRFPLSVGGWLIESARCSSGLAQATYKRTPTMTVNGFTSRAQVLGYRIDSMDEAGETGTLSSALSALPAGGDDGLIEMAALLVDVRSLLQGREAKFTLAPKNMTPPAPPVLPGQEAPPPPPAPDWKTQSFTIDGRQTPTQLFAGMEDLPGVRLLTVAVRRAGSDLEWSLTGEINGK